MRKLLIIEDEPLFCRLALQTFHPYLIHIAIAMDGESGIKTASTFRPDIILVDLNLPIVPGVAVIDELDIPCIAWSSSRLSIDVNAAYTAGAINYLFKGLPHELTETLDVLAKLLEQDNWLELISTPPSTNDWDYPKNFINRR